MLIVYRIMVWVNEEEEEENTKSSANRKILFVVLDMSSKFTYKQ